MSKDSKYIPFWEILIVYHGVMPTQKLVILEEQLIMFLQKRGFSRLHYGNTHLFIQTNNKIVRIVNATYIKDHIFKFIDGLSDKIFKPMTADNLRREIIRKSARLFKEDTLSFLKNTDLKFQRSGKESAFFYYSNGFVEVSKMGAVLRKYSGLKNHIWDTQIIDRKITLDPSIKKDCYQ